MISAIDRFFGFSGGESLALMAIAGLGLWLAYPHAADAQAFFTHAHAVCDRVFAAAATS